jgi:hypothetical protein
MYYTDAVNLINYGECNRITADDLDPYETDSIVVRQGHVTLK